MRKHGLLKQIPARPMHAVCLLTEGTKHMTIVLMQVYVWKPVQLLSGTFSCTLHKP